MIDASQTRVDMRRREIAEVRKLCEKKERKRFCIALSRVVVSSPPFFFFLAKEQHRKKEKSKAKAHATHKPKKEGKRSQCNA